MLSSLVVLTAFSLASAQVPQPAGSARLTALGSESLESVMLLWGDSYRSLAPDFSLDLKPEGSGAAPKALLEGRTHLALMSREMKPDEIAAFREKMGYVPTRIAVGMDAVVVLVNKNNPVREIKIEQLDAAFGSSRLQGWTADVAVWGDLGVTAAGWSTRPIIRWDRPAVSGTRSFFTSTVLLGGKPKVDNNTAVEEAGLNEELIANQAAIGYGSLSDVYSSLRAVPIVPKGGRGGIPPTSENVASGSYPLSRFLFIYINKAPGKPLPTHVSGFLNFALSPEGQKQLKISGQVPLPEELIRLNQRRLN